MKALLREEYGGAEVLRVGTVEKPVPAENEVLIKVMAASINRGDWYLLNGTPFLVRLSPGGLRKPRLRILGGDVAGWVEAVGANVTGFQVGDAVYGDLSNSGCGAYAEYVAAPETVLAHKPANLSFAERRRCRRRR
jgi:NADPH:quinone reductase-like Zn-dependent oxidoreductase